MDTPQSSTSQRRHQLIADKEFQLGFAWRLLLLQLAIVLGYQATFQLWINRMLSQGRSEETQAAVREILRHSLWTSAGVLVVGGVLVFCLGIWFSNRIVGPIPRFRRALRALAAGGTGIRLTFRPGDSMAGLAGDFNALAAALEEQRRGGASQGIADGSDASQPQELLEGVDARVG